MANLNLNKVVLGGRLTADPELKTTSNGTAVCSFTIAINRNGKGEDGKQNVDFIGCIAWKKTAEFICNYFRKGSSICISGSIQTRTWDDKDGNKRYTTEVIAHEAYFVDSKSENGSNSANTRPEMPPTPDDSDLPF